MPFPPAVARGLASLLLDEEAAKKVEHLTYNDAGHGYDAFGMHPDFVRFGYGVARPLYEKYFRVISTGHENIPAEGPAVIACNHSGSLPTDAMMLWTDIVRKTGRIPRGIADHFVPTLPWVGTLFARNGMVGGSRGNVRALLRAGELLMIFPEGVPGIGKHFRDRYNLQKWRVGHAELAIRDGAPIVPVALVGAEEQMPQIGRINLPKGLQGALPYIPLTATPLPMPVRYRYYYGEPIPIPDDYAPEDADDPEKVREAAARVEAAVDALLKRGLEERGDRIFA